MTKADDNERYEEDTINDLVERLDSIIKRQHRSILLTTGTCILSNAFIVWAIIYFL